MTFNKHLHQPNPLISSRISKIDFAAGARLLLLAFLLQSASLNAIAACIIDKGKNSEIFTVSVPSTLSIPRDTLNNTVLYESAYVANLSGPSFTCGTDGRTGVENKLGTSTTSDIFPIGDTGISWQWVVGGWPQVGYGGRTIVRGAYDHRGEIYALRLLKTGMIKDNATIPAGEIGSMKSDTIYTVTLKTNTELRFVAQSCESPDIKVDMGQYDLDIFSELGNTSKATSFNILLNNCPSGIKKVMYTLAPNPTTPAWNAALGIVQLNSTSTSKGIGLQLLNSDHNPLELNKPYVYNGYSSNGGSFRIPLSARYYRTIPASNGGKDDLGVTPGTANSEVSFVMSYL
jgi:type 1 fimbria pilin